MIFGIFWIVNFIKAKTDFITMVTAATFYFNSTPEVQGSASVMQGVEIAYKNHFGSIAFGSFIVSFVQIIRFFFLKLAESAAAASGENPVIRCAICVGNCCLSCIERVCDYITSGAYSYMAVSGDGFCSSAWNGFLLNMKHGSKFFWATFLANVFIFVGKLGIVVINCVFFWAFTKFVTEA